MITKMVTVDRCEILETWGVKTKEGMHITRNDFHLAGRGGGALSVV